MKRVIAFVMMMAVVMCCLTACGGDAPKAKEVNLAAVMEGFKLGDDMMTLDENDLMNAYGINADDVKQFAGATSIDLKADEIVLIEAKDADAAARVKSALDARYDAKVTETIDYQPEEYAVIKDCKVTSDGNFVAMIIAGNAADLTKAYNAAIK